MVLLIVILLVIAAITGTVWQVLEIAVGVALGIFFAAVLVAVGGYFLIRSRFRRFRRGVDASLGRSDRPRR